MATVLRATPLPFLTQLRSARIASTTIRPTNHLRNHSQRRTFLAGAFGPQTITASRTLTYPARQIYGVISDVSSYSDFVPYCRASIITKSSKPASDGQKYPEEAKLVIGFNNDVSEEFWSRIYCVPDKVVEAVCGSADTTLSAEEIRHHNARPAKGLDPTRGDAVLSHLMSRWTLRPSEQAPQNTEVSLAIEFQFANPVYAALSQAAAPKVADKMIEAFEQRFKAVVESSQKDQKL